MIKNLKNAVTADTFNKVYLRGRVVGYGHTASGIRSFSLMIRGSRMEGHPARNIVLNIAYGKAADRLPDGIPMHSVVEIEGHIVAYVYRNEVFDKWSYIQYIEADRIEFPKSELEESFGVSGFSYPSPYIKIYLKGELARVFKSENDASWTNISVRTVANSRNGRGVVRAQFSSRMRVNDVGMKCREGDLVCLVGTFSTNTKTSRNGGITSFENIIVDDMQIIRRREETAAAKAAGEQQEKAAPAPAAPADKEDGAGEAVMTSSGVVPAEKDETGEEVMKTAPDADAVPAGSAEEVRENAAEDAEDTVESLIGSM